jgi:NADH-quinone oxidoreductase subunit G
MTIFVDGKPYEVHAQDESKDLLTALIHLGVNLPYFCWHPALGSVGACRQCAVRVYRDESDQRGRIEMACMVPVKDGLRVAVEDAEAVMLRRRVIEWLMVNHPHDCPVCDEGGECHLQDMTVMTGHVYRRFRGRKRTYRNQYLGPFVTHEMNRCIQCFRCLRFYRDFAGGRDFDVFASKNHTYFGRHEDGVLQSEFSGNLVEVCPTGVFTDKTLARHYTRKWDLTTAPSICPHCGLGCNTIPGARYQTLRRIRARFHPEVNGYFLCDRGRYGYEFVNDPERIRRPLAGREPREEVDWREALARAATALRECRRVVGIGSPRADLEANFALKLLVGDSAFSPGLSTAEQEGIEEAIALLRAGPGRSAPLREIEWADAVLILGADPTNEAPMLDLAIRRGSFHACLDVPRARDVADWNDYPVRDLLQDARGPLFIAGVSAIKLEEIATESWHAPPPELAALAQQVIAALATGTHDAATPAGRIAEALAGAKAPLVVASATGPPALRRAAAEMARLLSAGRPQPCLLSFTVPECNSMGAALLGGRRLDEVLAEVASGEADGLIVVENDLFRRAAPGRVASALRTLRHLIVLDALPTQTTAAADLILPAATFAESGGTYVNSEGRAQRRYQVFVPEGEPRPAWRTLRDLIGEQATGWERMDDVLRALAEAEPALAGAAEAAPPATWRDRSGLPVAREPHRYSGRTAEHAHRTVFEPTPPEDRDSPFAFSMEGRQEEPPPALIPRYWDPGWNSPQALNRFRIETEGPHPAAPGARLIEPGPGGKALAIESEEAPLSGHEMWVVPRAAIFGSEELSRRAEGIAELTPPAAVALHPEEAAARQIADGDLVQFDVEGERYVLAARLDTGVARGVAVVPAGYPETAGLTATTRAKVGKAT